MKYYVCLFKKFNNYFNRIIKGYATLSEYQTAVGTGNFYLYANEVNYNPADNVSTELIINDCPFDADYLVYLNDNLAIVSRWFILETVKTRNGQYKHLLRRDVIYEYHNELMSAPVYVQKGMLSDGDPFILNSEGMSFNEIKTRETLLKDRSNSSWAVIYLAKNATPTSITVQVPSEDIVYVTLANIASEVGISEQALANLMNIGGGENIPAFFTNDIEFRFGLRYFGVFNLKIQLFFDGSMNKKYGQTPYALSWNKPLYEAPVKELGQVGMSRVFDALAAAKDTILPEMGTWTEREYLTYEQYNILQRYEGQIVLYNGGYYKFSINAKEYKEDDKIVGPQIYTAFSSVATVLNSLSIPQNTLQNDGEMSLRTKSTRAYLTLKNIAFDDTVPSAELEITSQRNTILDKAYDMIAINVDPVFMGNAGLAGNYALKMALAIAKDLDAYVYDVQLLPYCPMPELLTSDGQLNLDEATEHVDYDYIVSTGPFRARHVMLDSEWTIVDNGDNTVTATYTWANAYPLLTQDFVESYDARNPDLVSNVTLTKNGRNIEVSLTAASAEDVYDAMMTIYAQYNFIGGSATGPTGIVLYPKSADFTAYIDRSLSLTDSVKVESQCNKYRLVSPNYQGMFEFNVAKNGGTVSHFMADCTYKPYTPYIKVTPAFSYMYGTDYGDNRGLLCGGDFSLSRFTSAWESYQLNNKNYQNIFNREIQSLDLEQTLTMRTQIVGASVGTITGGVAGATTGAMASGSWIGAIVGGVVGTAGSALGGAIDTDMLARRQRDEKSLAIDKFNYQLGNIKALPYTLTKVGAFDINSKIWPFLEFYTCTAEEKQALENKILYESMTVMRIDYFGTYWNAFDAPRYFKGELIRNEEIAEDNHILEAIYTELLKGVFI